MADQNLNDNVIEIIFRISRLMSREMAYNSDVVNLSMLQLQALILIDKNKIIHMGDIATHFKIEMPTATSLLNKLVVMKLVKRKTDKKDRRIVRLNLTNKGKNLLKNAMLQRSKKINKLLFYLPLKNKKELLKILDEIVVKMEGKNEK